VSDPGGLWLLFAAAVAAGAVNAIAGGGTILTFAVLSAILPEGAGRLVTANVTSKIGLWAGAAAAAADSHGQRQGMPAWARWLFLPSVVGAVAGVALLRYLPQAAFDAVVPWLILAAAALFTLQPQLARLVARRAAGAVDAGGAPEARPSPARLAAVVGLLFLVGLYGGYFGAGIGILLLATLSVLGLGDIHRLNAAKNLLAAAINGVATAVLVAAAAAGSFAVPWTHVAVLVVGSVIGGIAAVRLARRLPAAVVRRIVAGIAFALAGYHFWREWVG